MGCVSQGMTLITNGVQEPIRSSPSQYIVWRASRRALPTDRATYPAVAPWRPVNLTATPMETGTGKSSRPLVSCPIWIENHAPRRIDTRAGREGITPAHEFVGIVCVPVSRT